MFRTAEPFRSFWNSNTLAPCCQRKGLIHLIIDGTNDKEYVGQTTRTVEERLAEHKRCQTSNIGRATRKHGAENFTTAILKECDS